MIDLSLPGYKYLGPGNSLDKGVPNGYNDFVAFLHDHGYNIIINRGGDPYFQWSEADAAAYRSFDATKDIGGALGKFYFGLKNLAYKAGLIPKFELGKNGVFTIFSRQSITPRH